MLQAFLVSTGVVGLAEMGDKTQLLALALVAKYRKPVPIVGGVLAATLISHACAGGVGTWFAQVLNPRWMDWAVVASFALMAVWILVPEKHEDAEVDTGRRAAGVFMATALAFLLAEMGDKTQVVTIALAARFRDFFSVVGGATIGMMAANVPVIFLGHRFADHLPAKRLHLIAAIIFVVLGGLALRHALQYS